MEGLESDHYRCPLYFLFFGRGGKLFLGRFQVLRVFDIERGAE